VAERLLFRQYTGHFHFVEPFYIGYFLDQVYLDKKIKISFYHWFPQQQEEILSLNLLYCSLYVDIFTLVQLIII